LAATFTHTALSIAMECQLLRNGCRRVIGACQRRQFHSTRKQLATVQSQPDITPASEIQFTQDPDQFALGSRRQSTRQQPRVQVVESRPRNERGDGNQRRFGGGSRGNDQRQNPILRRIRIVPASPSYFTATPRYTDDLLELTALLRKHTTLPMLPPGEAPRVAWKTIDQYKAEVAEPIRAKSYKMLLELLKRLNYIHPSLIPDEVSHALEKFKKLVQPHHNAAKPIVVDAWGRAKAVGKRKSSVACVFVVEGDGQVMVNGRSLTQYFGRLHDRETAIWGLKVTQRVDKYNVWAVVKGGGTTGQADAIALGVAKALLAHEPALKPALRQGGVITRDPRRVERKKPGKLKARKMPAWVKR
ncbi:hypothetical protein AC579_5506, partial [Pseudocercospora musae]